VNAAEVLAKFPDATRNGTGWKARCPAHSDSNPSLTISDGDGGRILLHCHAGCPTDSICAAVGLKMADLFPARDSRNGNGSRLVAAYDYLDESGNVLFQVCRFDPKDFRQRRPDVTALDGWTWKTTGVRRVLYRLPELLAAVAGGRPIFVAEGEKDVDSLINAGFAATCNPGGAGKWLDGYTEALRGADAIIVADKDRAGREHAQLVAAKLHGVAKSVRVMEVPDINGRPVKDAADFFAAGGQPAELDELAQAAPEWKLDDATAIPVQADIRGEIVRILLDGKPQAEQRTRIAVAVVKALSARGKFFFHAERKDFDSAMYFDGERKQLLRVRADNFLAWLSDWLAVNRADAVFTFIARQVETSALSGPQTTGILPENFWASRPGAIYLSNGDGQLAKITPGKVEVLDNGADGVLFAAGNTLADWTLTEPQDPFATCSLFSGANCAASHGLDLFRLWLYSLPTNPASKPPACFAGDIGSGKTRLAKGIAEFYGVPFVANKVEDFGEENFWVIHSGQLRHSQ